MGKRPAHDVLPTKVPHSLNNKQEKLFIHQYNIDYHTLETVQSVKYLGVHLHHKLN